MRTSVLDALFPRTRQKLLAVTYRDPRRWWFMSELARQLSVSPSSLQRELDSLARNGILVRRRAGKHVYFRAATHSPVFEELRGLILKTAGLADVLRGALMPFAARISWAFVHGSTAKTTEHEASDVDLMVVGQVPLAGLSPALRKAEQTLGRPVNPVIYTLGEFAARIKSRHHFVLTVLRAKKIFVLGDPREFSRTFGRSAAAPPPPGRR